MYISITGDVAARGSFLISLRRSEHGERATPCFSHRRCAHFVHRSVRTRAPFTVPSIPISNAARRAVQRTWAISLRLFDWGPRNIFDRNEYRPV